MPMSAVGNYNMSDLLKRLAQQCEIEQSKLGHVLFLTPDDLTDKARTELATESRVRGIPIHDVRRLYRADVAAIIMDDGSLKVIKNRRGKVE